MEYTPFIGWSPETQVLAVAIVALAIVGYLGWKKGGRR